MTTKVFSTPELREYLASAGANECHIYPYGYYDGETSEDPIQQIFGQEEAMSWIAENPAYSVWGELTGYMIVIFDINRNYVGTIIF